MRWSFWVGLGVAVLLAAYTAWPLLDLYKLARAVEARNASAVEERVDFGLLRRSLTDQVLRAYLKVSGRESAPLSGHLAGLITAADPLVERLLNPETLLDLLAGGGAPAGGGEALRLDGLSLRALGSIWQVYINSEYSGLNVSIWIPPQRPISEQFRLRLRLIQWKWKLAGIDLPESIRMRLAQEIVARTK